MSDDVVAVLQRAKERVAAGWYQGGYALIDGERYSGAGPFLVDDLARVQRVCAEGALWCEVGKDGLAFERAREFLQHIVGVRLIPDWNDAPGRTQAEVLDAFDAAIRLAKDSA